MGTLNRARKRTALRKPAESHAHKTERDTTDVATWGERRNNTRVITTPLCTLCHTHTHAYYTRVQYVGKTGAHCGKRETRQSGTTNVHNMYA